MMGTSLQISHVRFRVLEAFKGNPGSEIVIVTEGSPAFHKAGGYLIFATQSSTTHEMQTGICTRTHAVVDDSDPDLAWLRGYADAPPLAAIYGDLRKASGVPQPVSGLAIMLSGSNASSSSATTDDKGNYRFKDIQPGTYTLTASIPEGLVRR